MNKKTSTLPSLVDIYASHRYSQAILSHLKNDKLSLFIKGFHGSSSPFFFGYLYETLADRSMLFVLNNLEEAGYFYHDLSKILREKNVLFFPSSYKRKVVDGQIDDANVIMRTEALAVLENKQHVAIVTYPEALAEKVVSISEFESSRIILQKRQEIDPSELTKQLDNLNFEFVDYVYEPGQYAIRGSIVDVYSYSSEEPFRLDFFGEEIESIRTFDISSQLSIEQLDEITIIPKFKIKNEERVSLLRFFPPKAPIIVKDAAWVMEAMDSQKELFLSDAAREVHDDTINLDALFIHSVDFMEDFVGRNTIQFGNKAIGKVKEYDFHAIQQPLFHKNFDLVTSTFAEYVDRGYQIYICSDSDKQHDRIDEIFKSHGAKFTFTAVVNTIHEGFIDNDLKIGLFTDHQIFDRYHKFSLRSERARAGKLTLSLKELTQFEVGDYVVHTDHGIGRFQGLMRIQHGTSTQEVMKLTYSREDSVFVSIHSLHKVSKYKSKDSDSPRLSQLGSGAWQRLKQKTKGKLKDIARDLIKLYSKRKKNKGFAFSPDSFMQRELEASFRYEDTPDQFKATQDVKADMEGERPMDRLICGDVGFGKTEIAIRAAFKAVADNKQVAILVPTTVLAYQHMQSFTKRLKDMPCTIDYLSRARSDKQRSEILKKLKSGEINIIIGTHQLLNKSIQFKDLGLLIVDEEQKFGVSVKEKLRHLKVNIDTLTLTATPIPRTLQFSLIGARDLSVISTPPPNRQPIQTEVHTFSSAVVSDAVRFELGRNGQLFIVSNRISNLEDIRQLIKREVPDCRCCIGHGQMNPLELEKIIMDFVNHEYDVLIATTIIENGIDMPNVNTIIINNAQHFGLSALHQLRGRVGRSNRKAFCYLLAPPLSVLPQDSHRRLQAIENYSDLGSGIHIAMQDLDIRGAGNLLGAEQSGFVADLGYETYQKILNEAVQELKIDEFADLYNESKEKDAPQTQAEGDEFIKETTIESDMELLLPANYIPSNSERMLLYRELDGMILDEEVDAFSTRLIDRFGPIPVEAKNLLKVVPLKRIAAKIGIERLVLRNEGMSLYFIGNQESVYYQSIAFGKVLRYIQSHPKEIKTNVKKQGFYVRISNLKTIDKAVSCLKEIKAMP